MENTSTIDEKTDKSSKVIRNKSYHRKNHSSVSLKTDSLFLN